MINLTLIDLTGDDCWYWMSWIGDKIAEHSSKAKENEHGCLHGSTESNLWLRDLADEIWKRVKKRHDLTKYDENIICSRAMSLILTLWTCRIIRAKAYDPNRPVEARRQMMNKLATHNICLMEAMSDESNDSEYFPLQKWETPFSPTATDGKYV